MGWEYDGSEDDFNAFCNTNSSNSSEKYDNYFDNSSADICSPFLEKLLLYIKTYNYKGEEGIEYLNSLNKLSNIQSKVLAFVRKAHNYLFYDAKGEYIKNYFKYLNEIENPTIVDQRKELSSIRNQLIKLHLAERNKIISRKLDYEEEIYVNIEKINDPFDFSFKHTTFLNEKPCKAIEILSLSYATKYNTHILEKIKDYFLIEDIIEKVVFNLDDENQIFVYENTLIGNFNDNSSFELSPIYRPKHFNCIDHYEFKNKIKLLMDDYLHHKSKAGSFVEFIELYKSYNGFFIEKLYNALFGEINVKIKIPTNTLLGNFYDLPPILEIDFSIQRSPFYNEDTPKEKLNKIIKIKSENNLDSLIQEGKELLKEKDIY